ncbi:uncharacterized protein LOC116983886 isoform X2 [Amblyraja radiata]|uniref:uncharacterized protein LOC116983886 isoform X2 n=1 Tax=Amblyraja radiata TaxID=386614 RepID=UPI001402C5E8|nr:uncharacterized protein LOC116983886 isoform X2 [Amblyraja radiata]
METREDNAAGSTNQADKKKHNEYARPIQRLDDKETLFMLLALHMEESPLCESPFSEPRGDQINKTGIVMCESNSLQRIVAMDCSRKQLHAVQLVIMHLTTLANGCNVYLSRKPCTECAKCLVQGGVRSVRFWPKDPEFSLSSDKKRKDFYETNQIFRKSNTILVPFIPIINETTVYNLCLRTRRQKCEQCLKSTSEPSLEEELNTNWMDCGFTPQSDIEGMKAMIKSTVCSYYALLNCSHGTMPVHEEISLGIATHGLQLCFLLAARSDDPDRGVGAIIYNKKQYIVGAGYNGYIKKATYGNFPRLGRKKKSIPAKAKSMVHAEVNTLLFRSDRDIDSAVLVSSKTPCKECEMKIIASGIKTMVSVKDLPESERVKEWKHIVWKWPEDVQGNSKPLDSESKPKTESPGESPVGLHRLPSKADLMMCLALHMEASPLCKEPKEKGELTFCKAGIAILNTERNLILAIDCSRGGLHAVQQALISFPRQVQGCTVYLSRYPCTHCATLLIQGGVQQVCYWPNLELEKKDDMANITRVTQLFVEAEVIIDMYIPLLNLEKVKKKISPKIAVKPARIKKKCSSFFDLPNILDILEALGSSHMKEKDFKAKFMYEIENAHTCYCELLNSPDGSFEHQRSAEGHNDNVNGRQPNDALENDEMDIHALQLCFLLAARTDSPDRGVGAIICQDECFVATGYNGFPRGCYHGCYLSSRDQSETKNPNLLICAEANALYFRHKQDLKDATLYTSSYPCTECLDLIKETKGITRIVCVKPEGEFSATPMEGITCKMWKQNTDIKGDAINCLDFTSSNEKLKQETTDEGECE